jgi:outer membrane protein OmpA-like peptidoglycan-associated protein
MRHELQPIFGQSIHYILEGHKDREGSASYNIALSQRMADAVKSHLTYRYGIGSSLVFTSAYGESRPLIATADGFREPLNRRVEISFEASTDPTSEIGSQCDPALADL